MLFYDLLVKNPVPEAYLKPYNKLETNFRKGIEED